MNIFTTFLRLTCQIFVRYVLNKSLQMRSTENHSTLIISSRLFLARKAETSMIQFMLSRPECVLRNIVTFQRFGREEYSWNNRILIVGPRNC